MKLGPLVILALASAACVASSSQSSQGTGELGSATPDPLEAASDEPAGDDEAAEDTASAPGRASALRVFMAPDGDDTRSGLTPEDAVRSIARVHDLLVGIHGDEDWGRDVEVRVAAGRYVGQGVDWTHTSPTYAVTFMPAEDGARAVFDGCSSSSECVERAFFRLRAARGERTNLRFERLEIVRYPTAISLEGDRNHPEKSNGGNRIAGCRFQHIGNAHANGIAPSTAAVRLVNSDDNEISDNEFVDIVNSTSGGLLHAIYAAHGSDRNRITGNRFVRNSGDAVRVRDFSNGNVITKNRFTKVGTAAGYTEWYCDKDTRTDCTKRGPECPSWGNQFRDNVLDGDATCAPLPVFRYFQDDSATGCSRPEGMTRRLSTSGNVTTRVPCSGE